MRLIGTRKTPIGIDAGARRLKAAQALLRGREIVELVTASLELPIDHVLKAADAAEFRGLLMRRGFGGSTVALGAPADLLKIETLELPPATESAAMRQLASMEIGRIARLKPGGFECGACTIPAPARGGASAHMLATALPHAAADTLVEPFVQAGFDVATVCPAPSSLAAFVPRLHSASGQALNVIVDIGWTGTRLMVVHGPDLVFHRALQEVGVRSIRAELISRLDIPEDVAEHVLRTIGIQGQSADLPRLTVEGVHRIIARAAEAIRNELLLTQNYIAHRYQQFSLEQLLLTGGGASIPGVGEFLSEGAHHSVVTVSPKTLLAKTAADRTDLSPMYTSALAHALYALEAGK